MGNWSPVRDFEDEMMDMQPDYDMIYGCREHGYLSWHGDTLHSSKTNFTNSLLFNNEDLLSCKEQTSLKSKAKIRELALNNNSNYKKIGRQYDENDSDGEYTKEREIINMIRSCGLESDVNEHLDSKNTLPTIQSGKKYEINGNDSNFIVLLDESYFKLKPKKKEEDDSNAKTDENRKHNKAEEDGEMNMKNNADSESTDTDEISPTPTSYNANCIANFTSNENLNKTEGNSFSDYYKKMKLYTPREIYYKQKRLSNSTTDVPTKEL